MPSGLWLLGVTTILVLAAILQPTTTTDQQRLTLAGQWVLPELCFFKRMSQRDCPGCGLTRSIVLAVHGNAVAAWQMHPVGPLLLGYLFVSVPLRLRQMLQAVRGASVRSLWRYELAVLLTLAAFAYLRWLWSLVA